MTSTNREDAKNKAVVLRRRRARQRGFSSLPQVFEVGTLLMMYAFTSAGEKYLDSTENQQRAVFIAAQDQAHLSAIGCQAVPTALQLGDAAAFAKFAMGTADSLGLNLSMLPSLPTGLSSEGSFHTAHEPLRDVTSVATTTRQQAVDQANGIATQVLTGAMAKRFLNCQDIPQSTPTPDAAIKTLSTSLWMKNGMGY